MKAKILLIVGALVACAATNTAHADGFRGHGLLPVYGYGYSGTLYGLRRLPVPPYFAVHPPVYYHQRVSRSYGTSPYAWSGNPRGHARRVAPKLVINPMAKPAAQSSKVADEKVAIAPKMIHNPFVTQSAVANVD